MANIIEYSGYIGTIEYSQEDKYFFGKIDMINDLVTFEAQNATQLEENFKNVVDEYILTCKELNREPQKAFKGVFNVRTGSELHKLAVLNATKIGVSLNTYIKNLIEKDSKLSLN
ncbi:type II toxin-antitoxin system HicB family antitoxin [Aliarcobacter cryaerophilus]|uniref:type II toxin-antitoxin system HicB family antitoxin n=1 Tax=Aliarcobacter cryaerophilus TaxID=28198 RepID=UPI0021B6B336|nr:type II toxin-antitoxin system HicB family antitoxin [Aliarcobacter cryaerophilus]MCT7406227.1 type II toxin-antitoxin system HicB family antitoxin [Aliarcobacter cryaerophilus]MCT7504032.1 type II toxin-antitoxin system HicB family antitoxin [Aliarcobacter cryaerophilus]